MQTRFIPLVATCAVAGCGGPNPTLSLTVDALPARTATSTVQVTGSVTRSPSGDKPIVIAVAGGRAVEVDSIVDDGMFVVTVRLNTNAENQLAVTASDEDGAVSDADIVVIHHDDIGPGIQEMTPPSQSTDVPLDTPIEVYFAEPLLAGAGAAIELLHNKTPVAGSATLSTDQRRVTFTPSEALLPNSVYELRFAGYTDETGNIAGAAGDACFLTAPTGTVLHTATDTLDLGWERGTPEGSLRDINLAGARFARRDSTLYGLIEFGTPRVMAAPDDNSGLVFIELDTDQSSTTGFTSLRDTIFRQFPEFDSDLGVEYVVGLEPAIGDSGYVAMYTNPLEFQVLDAFVPGTCGRYYGFHTTALLDSAGDDGRFDYTVLAFSIGTGGDYLDPMPEGGHLTADLTGPVPFEAYRTDLLRPRRSASGPREMTDRWRGVLRRRGAGAR